MEILQFVEKKNWSRHQSLKNVKARGGSIVSPGLPGECGILRVADIAFSRIYKKKLPVLAELIGGKSRKETEKWGHLYL